MDAVHGKLVVLGVVGIMATRAFALGPHEVLLLINGESRNSVEIGRTFARLRGVPGQNVVTLSLPEKMFKAPVQVTPNEFTELIWKPANAAAKRNRVDDHILAWIYSADFPTRVSTDPVMSIQGLTFLRNKPPEAEETVKMGTYVSPLFAGPSSPDKLAYGSQTLGAFKEWLGAEMPLPSMMLGYTQDRGNTKTQILECLQRGVQSDFTAPAGTVYFVTNSNIRSTVRQWQFPGAVKALGARGVEATIVPRIPDGRQDIMGLVTGAADVDPGKRNTYLPGSIGEHFTSWAARFHVPGQSKLSVWIAAGAVASAGTVVEPYAKWTKFPNGWLFVHYASGCCVLESFYQSIRCPLQTLIVGAPLAQPWAPRAELEIRGVGKGSVSGVLELEAHVRAERARYVRFVYLLDGRVVGSGKRFSMDTRKVDDGRHLLRVVGYRTGLVRNQTYVEKPIVVANAGKNAGRVNASPIGIIRELISQP